jgi:hypothetical protein
MGTTTLKHASRGDRQEWKAPEYHGTFMSAQFSVAMRMTIFPAMDSNGISKYGSMTTALDRQLMNAPAESDPERFYSTQVITEDLGFIRGRELVERT